MGKVSLQDTDLGGDTWPLVAPAKPPNIIHCGRKPGAASRWPGRGHGHGQTWPEAPVSVLGFPGCSSSISYQPGFAPASLLCLGQESVTGRAQVGTLNQMAVTGASPAWGQRPRGNGETSEWPQSQLLLYDRHLHLLVNQWHVRTWCSLKTFHEYFKCVLHVQGHKALGAIISMDLVFNFPTCERITSEFHPLALFSLCTRGLGPDTIQGSGDGANPSPPSAVNKREGSRKGSAWVCGCSRWTDLLQQSHAPSPENGRQGHPGLPRARPALPPNRAAKSRNRGEATVTKITRKHPALRRRLTTAAANLWKSPVTGFKLETYHCPPWHIPDQGAQHKLMLILSTLVLPTNTIKSYMDICIYIRIWKNR